MQEQVEEDWLDENTWICPKCGNTGNWIKGEDYEIWYFTDFEGEGITCIVCCKCWYSEKEVG